MEVDHRCRVRHCVNPAHLRLASSAEQKQNQRVRSDSRTGVRGVRVTPSGKFRARVQFDGVTILNKVFDTLEEAEAAAIAARNLYYTHNDIDRVPDRLALAS
jgi:hypothetical protein